MTVPVSFPSPTRAAAYNGGTGNVALGFGYNQAGQITSLSRSNDAYAWTGAVNVNRAYTTNGLNQYTAAGTANFTYDANGNLTSDGTSTFTYDVENRLVARSGGVGLRYDPLGRLYEVTGTSGWTRFLYDGDALVAEYVAVGLASVYVHGSNTVADDPLVWYVAGTMRWLHSDHEGSITGLADPQGNLASINSYDEYGIPAAGNYSRFQYTGQIWLAELGMYYYKARIYSPTLGRFLQTDPVGYEDQFNLYAYVGNDPVNAVDPTGKETCGGTPAQCAAYSAALNLAEQSARSPHLSAAERRELRGVIRSIRSNRDYIILFSPKAVIDEITGYRGFSFTNITRRGTIYTVLPDDFATLFDSYRPMGYDPQAERAGVVAHEGSHEDDYRTEKIRRGDRFTRDSATERKADNVQQNTIRAARQICTGTHICRRLAR